MKRGNKNCHGPAASLSFTHTHFTALLTLHYTLLFLWFSFVYSFLQSNRKEKRRKKDLQFPNHVHIHHHPTLKKVKREKKIKNTYTQNIYPISHQNAYIPSHLPSCSFRQWKREREKKWICTLLSFCLDNYMVWWWDDGGGMVAVVVWSLFS